MTVLLSKQQGRRGFTVVELLVGMTVFVVVLSIAVGTFVRGLRLQRDTVSLITVNDSMSLVLEQMAREIRTASNFTIPSFTPACTASTPVECTVVNESVLEYTTGGGTSVRYMLNSQTGIIERSTAPFTNPLPLTSEDVLITRLSFALKYFVVSNAQQVPRVTISVVGRSADADPFLENVEVRLQTTVSRRS